MTRTDDYRRKAAECRKQAAEARDLNAKVIHEEMAREWDDLAKQIAMAKL